MAVVESASSDTSKKSFDLEEKLIGKVREKPYLYDKSHASYKDTRRKRNAYDEIEEALGLEAKTAKGMWDRLKKQYTQYLKKLDNPSGSGTKEKPYFRHAGIMNFYQKVYRPFKTQSNVVDLEDENEDESAIPERGPEPPTTVVERDTSGVEVAFEGFEGEEPEVIVHNLAQKSKPSYVSDKTRTGNKKRKISDDFNEKLLAAIEESGKNTGDEFDHFGAYIAGRTRKLNAKNPRLSIELQHKVQEVLKEYELLCINEIVVEQVVENDADK